MHVATFPLTPLLLFRCCSTLSRVTAAVSCDVPGLSPGYAVGERGGVAAAPRRVAVKNGRTCQQQQEERHSQRGGDPTSKRILPSFSQYQEQHVGSQPVRHQPQEGHLQAQYRDGERNQPQQKPPNRVRQGSAHLHKQTLSQQDCQKDARVFPSQSDPIAAQHSQPLLHLQNGERLRQQPHLAPVCSHSFFKRVKSGPMEKKAKKIQPWQRMLHWQQVWLRQKRWTQKHHRQQAVADKHRLLVVHPQRQNSDKQFIRPADKLPIQEEEHQQESSLQIVQPVFDRVRRTFCGTQSGCDKPLPQNMRNPLLRCEPRQTQQQVRAAAFSAQKRWPIVNLGRNELQHHQRSRHSQTHDRNAPQRRLQKHPCASSRRQSLSSQQKQSERQTQLNQQENPSLFSHRSASVSSTEGCRSLSEITSEQLTSRVASDAEPETHACFQLVEKFHTPQDTTTESGGNHAEHKGTAENSYLTHREEEKRQRNKPQKAHGSSSNAADTGLQARLVERRFALRDGTPRQILWRPPSSCPSTPRACEETRVNVSADEAPSIPSGGKKPSVEGRREKGATSRTGEVHLCPEEFNAQRDKPPRKAHVHEEQFEKHVREEDARVGVKEREKAKKKELQKQLWKSSQNHENQHMPSNNWKATQGNPTALLEVEAYPEFARTIPYPTCFEEGLNAVAALATRLRLLHSPSSTFFGSTFGANAAGAAALRNVGPVRKCVADVIRMRGCATAAQLLDDILRQKERPSGYPAGKEEISHFSRAENSRHKGETTNIKVTSEGAKETEPATGRQSRADNQSGIKHDGTCGSSVSPQRCGYLVSDQKKEPQRDRYKRGGSAKRRHKKRDFCCAQRHHSFCCRYPRYSRPGSNRRVADAGAPAQIAVACSEFHKDLESRLHTAKGRTDCRPSRRCSRRSSRRHYSKYRCTSSRTEKKRSRRTCCCGSRRAAHSHHRRLYRLLMHVLALASRTNGFTDSAAQFAMHADRSRGAYLPPCRQTATRGNLDYDKDFTVMSVSRVAAERAEIEAAIATALRAVDGLNTERDSLVGGQEPATAPQSLLRFLLLLSPGGEKDRTSDEGRAPAVANRRDNECSMQSSSSANSADKSKKESRDTRTTHLRVESFVESRKLPQSEEGRTLEPAHELKGLPVAAEEVTDVLQSTEFPVAPLLYTQPSEGSLWTKNPHIVTQVRQESDLQLQMQDCYHNSVQQSEPEQGTLEQISIRHCDLKQDSKEQDLWQADHHQENPKQSVDKEKPKDVWELNERCRDGPQQCDQAQSSNAQELHRQVGHLQKSPKQSEDEERVKDVSDLNLECHGKCQQLDQTHSSVRQELQRGADHLQENLKQPGYVEESKDILELNGKCQSTAVLDRAYHQKTAAAPVAAEHLGRRSAQGMSPRAAVPSDKKVFHFKRHQAAEYVKQRPTVEDTGSLTDNLSAQEAKEVQQEIPLNENAKPQTPHRAAEGTGQTEARIRENIHAAERREIQTKRDAVEVETLLSEKKTEGRSHGTGHRQRELGMQKQSAGDGEPEESRPAQQQESGKEEQTRQRRRNQQSESPHQKGALVVERQEGRHGDEQPQKLTSVKETETVAECTEEEKGRKCMQGKFGTNEPESLSISGRSVVFDKVELEILDYRQRFTDRLLQREPLLSLRLQEEWNLQRKSQREGPQATLDQKERCLLRRGKSASTADSRDDDSQSYSQQRSSVQKSSFTVKQVKDLVEEGIARKGGTTDSSLHETQELHRVLQAHGSWAVSATVAEEFLEEFFEEAVEEVDEYLAAAVDDLIQQEQRTLLAIRSAKNSAFARSTICC